MTSTTIKSSSGAGHRIKGYGLLIFASVLLMVLGVFNLLDGIAAVAPNCVPHLGKHSEFAGISRDEHHPHRATGPTRS